MNELEQDIMEDLLKIYSQYLKEGITTILLKNAKSVYFKYVSASPLLSEQTNTMLNFLGDLGPSGSESGLTPLTRELAEKFVHQICKKLAELER